MNEEDLPRPKGDAAGRLASEDLAPYSREELNERITLLEAEIARVRAHRENSVAHHAAANALFSKPDS